MTVDYQRIQKLKGSDNYNDWEVALRSALIVNKLYKVVKPDYIPPVNPSTLPNTGKATATDSASTTEGGVKLPTQEEYDDYLDTNEQALAAIHLTMSSWAYQQIKQIATAKEAWAKLKELFGTDSYASIEEALFALTVIRSESYKNLNEYLSDFKKHLSKLDEMNCGLPALVRAAFFRKGLPKHMAPYTFTLYKRFRTLRQEIDLDYVTNALISHVLNHQYINYPSNHKT